MNPSRDPHALCCGCSAVAPCSLAALLLRAERFMALRKHLSESYSRTLTRSTRFRLAELALRGKRIAAGLEETRENTRAMRSA